MNDRPFESMEKIMEMQMKEMEGVMNSFMKNRDSIFEDFFGRDEEENALKRPFKEEFNFNKQNFLKSAVDNNNNNKVNTINNIFTFNNVFGNNDNNRVNADEPELTTEAPTLNNDDVCGACVNITTVSCTSIFACYH